MDYKDNYVKQEKLMIVQGCLNPRLGPKNEQKWVSTNGLYNWTAAATKKKKFPQNDGINKKLGSYTLYKQ